MKQQVNTKRTNSSDPDFQLLVTALDNELWNELLEDQGTYDQYNKVPDIKTAVVVYVNEKPAAIGCFKIYDDNTVEIKRMFVVKEQRGRGLSSIVLKELENWAEEAGFQQAILETSIHFIPARSLYTKAGYITIPNYDQYAQLAESVCMKKIFTNNAAKHHEDTSSPFRGLGGIEYFGFEEDFVEENVRCIPMIVRFKMDKAGIKLKLSEWCKFKNEERIQLALLQCETPEDVLVYNRYLTGLIWKYAATEATVLQINEQPDWANLDSIPVLLQEKANEFDWQITIEQWKGLTNLQRFALTKLYRPGHENKNFPKAIKEFGLLNRK
jgi:hypothetical protein